MWVLQQVQQDTKLGIQVESQEIGVKAQKEDKIFKVFAVAAVGHRKEGPGMAP